jgi:hypothetical protein
MPSQLLVLLLLVPKDAQDRKRERCPHPENKRKQADVTSVQFSYMFKKKDNTYTSDLK